MTITIHVNGIPAHIAAGIDEVESGCWLWTKSLSRDGYGWASLGDRTYQAHRLVYRLIVGEIPDGMVIDHVCRVRNCVNPQHMEPVTPAENLRRSHLTPAGQVKCLRCGAEFVRMRQQRRCPDCCRAYEESRRESKRNAERARRAKAKEGGS